MVLRICYISTAWTLTFAINNTAFAFSLPVSFRAFSSFFFSSYYSVNVERLQTLFYANFYSITFRHLSLPSLQHTPYHQFLSLQTQNVALHLLPNRHLPPPPPLGPNPLHRHPRLHPPRPSLPLHVLPHLQIRPRRPPRNQHSLLPHPHDHRIQERTNLPRVASASQSRRQSRKSPQSRDGDENRTEL